MREATQRPAQTARWRRGAAVACGVIVALGMVPAGADAAPGTTVTPVVGGLNSPRGVAFDGRGSLYVTESGQWQGTFGPSGPTGEGVTQTGSVRKYTGATTSPQLAWRTAFTSLFDSDPLPEALGPEGISALGNGCMSNSHGQRNGCQLQMIMSESQAGYAAGHSGARPAQIGHLLRLDGATGAIRSDLSNVGDQQYAWTGMHPELDPGNPDQFPDANPYGVLVTRHATFVADAGANTISRIGADGVTHVLAYIPNDGVSDATPTCVAQGPDGALYVATLNLDKNSDFSKPFPGAIGANPGHSDVWRIAPRTREGYLTAAHLWATGLTTVTACTFDRHGDFWATEMFQPAQGPPGDIARVRFSAPGTIDRFGGGQLPLPGGIAFGPDDHAYVTIGSADTTPGAGAVVRVATTG